MQRIGRTASQTGENLNSCVDAEIWSPTVLLLPHHTTYLYGIVWYPGVITNQEVWIRG